MTNKTSDNQSYDLAEGWVLEVIDKEQKEPFVHVSRMEQCDCIPVLVVDENGWLWRLMEVIRSSNDSLIATYENSGRKGMRA